jgi:DHA1 family multidrug resistance protein-like MFS transporter
MPVHGTQGRSLLWRPFILRLLLIALFAEIGFAMLNLSTMPVYLKYDRGFGTSVIGLVFAAFLISEALFKGPMGGLADRVGRKRLIVIGPAMSFFTALLTLAVPHDVRVGETLLLVALRAVDGLGAAMLWPAAFALISESVEDHERQQAMSLMNVSFLLGIALAMLIGGAVNDLFGRYLEEFTGDRSPGLFLAAGLFAVVAISAYRLLPSDRDSRARRQAATVKETTTVRELFDTARRIPTYLILAAVMFAGVGFPMAIIKIFAQQQYGMSESAFGALVLPTVGGMALLAVPMARFGDQIGRERAVHIGLGLCLSGMALIALGSVVVELRAPAVLALGALPVGLGFLLAIPAWYASVSDLEPARRASNIGAVMTAQGLGAIVGMPIGAIMYEKATFLDHVFHEFAHYTPFIGCTICLLIGWLLSLRYLRPRTQGPAHGPDK